MRPHILALSPSGLVMQVVKMTAVSAKAPEADRADKIQRRFDAGALSLLVTTTGAAVGVATPRYSVCGRVPGIANANRKVGIADHTPGGFPHLFTADDKRRVTFRRAVARLRW